MARSCASECLPILVYLFILSVFTCEVPVLSCCDRKRNGGEGASLHSAAQQL